MRRAKEVDDTGLVPFVDTEATARYLALSPHSLECYRSLGGGPPLYKVGKFRPLCRARPDSLDSYAAARTDWW